MRIDEFPSANTPLSDGDLMLVEQNGHLRKVAKAQVSSGNDAEDIVYDDNTIPPLNAINVQDAIEALAIKTSTGVPDGDKGDVIVAGSGTNWTIDNKAITFSKMQDVSSGIFLGRNTFGTGSPELIDAATAKSMLNLVGTNTGDQDLSSLVPNTRTVAGKALSSNITLSYNDLSDTGFLMSQIPGASSQATVTDCTTALKAELELAATLNKTLVMQSGFFYTRALDPNSSIRLKGQGEETIFLSAKDMPFILTTVNAKAYQEANTIRLSVTALDMGLSFNPLSTENTYVSRLRISTNAVTAGVRSKMRARIFSDDIHPYTNASTKKARYGEDFEILRVDALADGTSYIYVKGRLAWHDFYTTSITVNIWDTRRVYEFSDFKVMGKKKLGYVTKAFVTNPGSGYTSLPTITPNNTGTGDSGAIFAASMGLDAIVITNGGSGYSNGNVSLTITGGGASRQATATCNISGGVVGTVTITNPGDKYTSVPTITVTSGGGSGAVFTPTMRIQEIHVGTQSSPGLGQGTGHGTNGTYTSAPTLTFSGGGGTGAAGSCIIDGDCFDADYDVDITLRAFHAHALGLWYCPNAVIKNLVFDDMWEGGLELRHSPFSIVENVRGERLANFKTGITSPWQGRLGYLFQNQNSSFTRYVNTTSNVCRHGYTDGNEESTSVFANTQWLTWGTTCNVSIDGWISNGCEGTLFGPHEGCNGFFVSNVIDINSFQGDQDESYRGCTLQLRGCNIHVNGMIIRGGSDGVRYQDTEQPTGYHMLDNIIIENLTDSSENSHGLRVVDEGATLRSPIYIGDMIFNRVGKAIRVDNGGQVYVLGKVSATDIGNVAYDVQNGGKLVVNESYSDFFLNSSGSLTTSRKDYNVSGSCTLIINKHTCRLGSTKNPSTTFSGSPTSASITLGELCIINDASATVPKLVPVSHANFLVSSLNSSRLEFNLWDSSLQFKRKILTSETLTAERTLTINAGDGNRTWTMTGDLIQNPGGSNGFLTTVRTVTASGAITVTNTDMTVYVNKTVGAASAVSLFASPATGQVITIKDAKGDANLNNITITPAAGNIDGAGTYVINTAYGGVILEYNGTQWFVKAKV